MKGRMKDLGNDITTRSRRMATLSDDRRHDKRLRKVPEKGFPIENPVNSSCLDGSKIAECPSVREMCTHRSCFCRVKLTDRVLRKRRMSWTDREIIAWLDERLSAARMAELEQQLRIDEVLRNRVAAMIRHGIRAGTLLEKSGSAVSSVAPPGPNSAVICWEHSVSRHRSTLSFI